MNSQTTQALYNTKKTAELLGARLLQNVFFTFLKPWQFQTRNMVLFRFWLLLIAFHAPSFSRLFLPPFAVNKRWRWSTLEVGVETTTCRGLGSTQTQF